MNRSLIFLLICAALAAVPAQSPYEPWRNGPPTDPGWFPIGVWLQSPRNAAKYKALGINLYVGQWKGPTKQQLSSLAKAGMPLIAAQTVAALGQRRKSPMIGWAQVDEPDNAQPKAGGGYGPPIDPAEIVKRYRELRKADRTRPVFLNFGQGVANDAWRGRGVRTGHLEDYPEYMKGADIVCFDIYPVTHSYPQVKGRLELVAKGVERLVGWAKGKKVVWNFIECTHINSNVMPTPAEVRAEVWMSLIHGSQGIIYFAHEWKPVFAEAGLLKYPAMMKAVAGINQRIQSLAPVLRSQTDKAGAEVRSTSETVPVAHMLKRCTPSYPGRCAVTEWRG